MLPIVKGGGDWRPNNNLENIEHTEKFRSKGRAHQESHGIRPGFKGGGRERQGHSTRWELLCSKGRSAGQKASLNLEEGGLQLVEV